MIGPRAFSLQHAARAAAVKIACALTFAFTSACSAPVSERGGPAATGPDARPDILLVITDDQGWGDWEGAGNPDIRTPNMMRLAAQGASLTDFHVSPVCAPTRASLLSGRHSLETGVWGVTRGGERMRPDVVTLAEGLRAAGYRTGMFGKWHNGDSPPYDPASQGFDRVFGFLAGHFTDYFDPVLLSDGEAVETTGFITTVITDAALAFMAGGDAPRFTYVAYPTPHSPLEVPSEFLDLYAGAELPEVTRVVYAMTTQLDAEFGRLLDAAPDDAIVIFVGDNGPARPGGVDRFKDGLNGQKGSVLFGGTQVPMIVRWPGVTEPGAVLDPTAQHIDVLPSLLAGLGLTPPAEVDGRDIRPLLAGGTLPERIHFTHHSNVLLDASTVPVTVDPGAARRGRFSAVLDPDGNWALYADRAQVEDVKDAHPEVFAELRDAYLDWFAAQSPGAGRDLPTVIQGAPVSLPAHNGYPAGGAAWDIEWGWSHEWVNVEGEGTMRWPVRGDGGSYDVELLYGGAGTAGINSLEIALPRAEAPNARPGPGHRRVVSTGEAITRDWARATLPGVRVAEGEGALVLSLSSPDGSLSFKGLRVVPAR